MAHTERRDEQYVTAAKAALQPLPDFGYHGDKNLFRSWGLLPFTQHRDSHTADRSNYRTILAALQQHSAHDSTDRAGEAPDLVEDMRAACWAHGWREHILCRVLIDDTADITIANLTHVFRVAVDIAQRLVEHPILDEDDLGKLESEESWEAFDTAWNGILWIEVSPNFTDEQMKDAVYRELTAAGLPDGFSEQEIVAAVIDWTWNEAWEDYARVYAAQLPLFDVTLTPSPRA